MSAMDRLLDGGVQRSSNSASGLELLLEPPHADLPEPHPGATGAQTAFNLCNIFMASSRPCAF